jgi:hypothetical protein
MVSPELSATSTLKLSMYLDHDTLPIAEDSLDIGPMSPDDIDHEAPHLYEPGSSGTSKKSNPANGTRNNFDHKPSLTNSMTSHTESVKQRLKYDWRRYAPKDRTIWHFFQWFVSGDSAYAKQSDEEADDKLISLARCLSLLRFYDDKYGMPTEGGPRDRAYVLRQVVRDLYRGGIPMYVSVALRGVYPLSMRRSAHLLFFFCIDGH